MSASFRWGLALLALALSFWLSLFLFFPLKVAPIDALTALWSDQKTIASITVGALRLPRAIAAMLLGASLALAGTLLQAITRNPLSSPTVLGINSGASLATVIAIAFAPSFLASYSLTIIAAVGGALSWGLVMLVAAGWSASVEKSRLVLAGIAVSMLCAALTRMTIILAEDNAASVLNWLAGSVSHARWHSVYLLLPYVIPAILISLVFAKQLNLFALSDDTARSLGVNIALVRLFVNLAALLLVGTSVAVAGPLSFVGLLVPHLARYIIGYDLRKVIPLAMILGATIMLLADMGARWATFPNELPAGAIIALIGAPWFVWLARRK